MGCLWCGKYSRQCKTMPSGPPESIPPFIPVTGMKCSYGKISSPLTEISVGKTEISGTEPARPLIWTHRKFYKGFRGEARSRKQGQPGQPGSYEEALNALFPAVNWIFANWSKSKLELIKPVEGSIGRSPLLLVTKCCNPILFVNRRLNSCRLNIPSIKRKMSFVF